MFETGLSDLMLWFHPQNWMLRQVFTSERVRVGIVSRVLRALILNRSYKKSQKQKRFSSSTSACDFNSSLDHEQQSHKQNQNAIFTRLLNLTLLITTPTPTPTQDAKENQPLVTNHLVTDSWSRTSNWVNMEWHAI